jgi:hypothetical protein
MCSLSRMPGAALARAEASVALLHLQRVAAQVVAVKLDQVEGVEEDACVMPPVADAVEARHAVVVAGDSFVVDDAGARAQPRLDDQREAVGQVVARSAVEPHAVAVLAGDDAETVVLDLVQPRSACWRLRRFGGEAGRDERCGARQTGGRMVRSP